MAEEKTELNLKDKDEDIVKVVDKFVEESTPLTDARIKKVKENDKWFDGKQWEGERQEYQSDTTINRIFPGVRSIVGLATDSRPKGDILPAPADTEEQMDINKQKAKRLSLLFDQRWDELQMNSKSTKTLFRAIIHDDAYWMPFWNYYDNDIDNDLLRPNDVYIDPTANTVEESRYVIFRPYKNKKWFQDNFPDKLEKIKFGDVKENPTSEKQSVIEVEQKKGQARVDDCWTDEIRVIKVGKEILWKGPNPLFEFRSDEEQAADWEKQGNPPETFVPVRNYFRRAKKPLIIIPTINTGELNSRSIFDQLKPVQRTIDKRKQQIDENANQMANGQWVYDTNFMDEATANMLTSEPGLQIGIDGIDHIRKESGVDMPSYVLEDLKHSESTFDNILGNHDISRGAKQMTNTATEASILQEADQTPVRLLVRNYEAAILDLYQWWMQLISLFYTEDHYVRVWGQEETINFLTVSKEDVSDGINIIIRPGSTLPIDKATMKKDAIQLAQMGQIDPLTLYEIFEMPDPMKAATRLLNWKNGTISDQKVEQPVDPNAPGGPPPPPTAEEQQAQAEQDAANQPPPPEPGNPGISPDVDWAQAEQQRISQGEEVQIRPDMVTPQHVQVHQTALNSGTFPEEEMLISHAEQEMALLQKDDTNQDINQDGVPDSQQ